MCCTGIRLLVYKQARTVFNEFIMINKHGVLGFKAKLWGSTPELGDFSSFLIKIPHFEAYLSLNFY